MGNRSIWIAGILTVFIGLLFASRVNEKKSPKKLPIVSGTAISVVTEIPLQQETDILRQFFTYIQQKQITKAVGMMSDEITQNDSVKQAWGAQLNAMRSVKVISIDTSLLGDWTSIHHTYKVLIEMKMDPSSVNSPIPYYGYENGTNTRFISLVKSGTIWKINGIATGP